MSCLGLLNLADSFDCAEHTHYVRVQRSTAYVYWEWLTQLGTELFFVLISR